MSFSLSSVEEAGRIGGLLRVVLRFARHLTRERRSYEVGMENIPVLYRPMISNVITAFVTTEYGVTLLGFRLSH